MKVAIVAHYDPEETWDANFISLLQVLSEVVDRTIVVTTSEGIPDLPAELSATVLVKRPNVGYDFYSYRVGLHFALSYPDIDGLFILNSSIILLDSEKFRRLLRYISRPDQAVAVRGVTSSTQVTWHIQSYLLYFNFLLLPSGLLQKFFNEVEPLNSKFEIVLRYEIGLGKVLRGCSIPVETVFRPSFRQTFAAAMSLMRSFAKTQGSVSWLKTKTWWHAFHDINWTHFGAGALAQRFGIVKTELLRTNPHGLALKSIMDCCETGLLPGVQNVVKRTRQFYGVSHSGLSELKRTNSYDPLGIINNIIDMRRCQKDNARIAVVSHLFYLDLLDEILEDLDNIIEPFDLFITTPFEADIPQIFDASDKRCLHLVVVLCKNQGRDVGPFIALFRTGLLDDYEAVLKLHSKKSSYSAKGNAWRRDLFSPLCGSSLTVLRSLRLLRESGCGLVGPTRYFLTNPLFWGANRENLAVILSSCRINIGQEGPELAFFAGTMFWFVPFALSAIHRCEGRAVVFEQENGKQDGTLAHAWERAFCLLVREAGYGVSSVELGGLDSFTSSAGFNRVPVL